MNEESAGTCRLFPYRKERNKIGVWGFGNVSRDVVLSLLSEGLGKEIVFYGRPKGDYPNRAGAWIEDLKANLSRGPRLMGTNSVEDMAGLDVIFVGVGAPRREGQNRSDLLSGNTRLLAGTTLQIRELYEGCGDKDKPILIYMGNPVTAMTWVGYKMSGFPRENIMGQAGNLDSRRICYAISKALGVSVKDVQGIVFGEHGDSMVATARYFSVRGIPLEVFLEMESIDRKVIDTIIEEAKKGGTHFVNETGQSASAGPARAAGEMLRAIISGESEVQPVVAILKDEYRLLKEGDELDSIGFGVPARIGPYGVEKIYELNAEGIRPELETSAALVKKDIRTAADLLKQEYGQYL
jgi:malate dehydrogenase